MITVMAKLLAPVVASGTLAGVAQPTITIDQDLALRPFQFSDTVPVVEAFTTSDIGYYHVRGCANEGEARQWIAEAAEGWAAERGATWAIQDLAGDAVLGRVTMYTTLAVGLGEVSYWVLPSARGRGVATRAAAAATKWAHSIGLHRVELQHSIRNVASRRVAVAAGFTYEGVRRSAGLHADGWHDMVLHAHVATDEGLSGR